MRRNLIAILSVAAMAAAFAAPASAQETHTVWHTDGKRYWRTEEPGKAPEVSKTYLKEVPAGEQKEGDIQGRKVVGKRTEVVYFRETPLATETAKGHECSWRMVYEGKTSRKFNFCVENGVEMPCAGMSDAGECLGMKKK